MIQYAIKIKAQPQDATWAFEKSFANEAEFQAVQKLCVNRSRVGMLGSTFITVRTHNLKDFAKDFFLPTFVNVALKTNDLALKVILALPCLALDLVTWPLRVITLFPCLMLHRIFSKEKHPLYKYLVANQAPDDLLKRDHVYVVQESVDADKPAGKQRSTSGETFNFIELPQFESPVIRQGYSFLSALPRDLESAFRDAGIDNPAPAEIAVNNGLFSTSTRVTFPVSAGTVIEFPAPNGAISLETR